MRVKLQTKNRLGKKNGQWKGDRAGYDAIHDYIFRHHERPNNCEQCGRKGKYVGKKNRRFTIEMANMGKYTRDIKDWKWLCLWCHRRRDYKLNPRERNNLGQFI